MILRLLTICALLTGASAALAEFDGYFALGGRIGHPDFIRDKGAAYALLQYNLDHSAETGLGTAKLHLDGAVRLDGAGQTPINRTQALRQAYIRLSTDWLTLTLGRQVQVQGVADGFLPTDVISPRNFQLAGYETQGSRFGVDGLQAEIFLSSAVTLSVFALAHTRSHVLPDGIYPVALRFTDQPVRGDDPAYGGRVDWSASFGDIGLSVYSGAALRPYLALDGAQIDPVVPGMTMVGLDFDTVLGPWRMFAEAAWHEYDSGQFSISRSLLPRNEIQAVFGLERELVGTSRLGLQVFHRSLRNARPAAAAPAQRFAEGVRLVYGQFKDNQTGASLTYNWESEDTRTAFEISVSSWFEQDSYLRLRGKRRLSDKAALYFYTDWFDGPRGTPFGALHDSSALGLEYRFFF